MTDARAGRTLDRMRTRTLLAAGCALTGVALGSASAARATRCPLPQTTATLELESTTIDGEPFEADASGSLALVRDPSSYRLRVGEAGAFRVVPLRAVSE